MNKAIKTDDHDATARTDQADKPISDAVCYRMEPAKQMLHHETCDQDCHLHAIGDANAMPPCLLSEQQHSVVNLEGVCRVALMVTPQPCDNAIDEAWEAISTIRVILKQQSVPMAVTKQLVFVRSADDIESFRQLFRAYFGDSMPATSYIVQPPCGGQALAIEAWAIGGDEVQVHFPGEDLVTIEHDRLRWIYAGGITSSRDDPHAYEEAESAFNKLQERLESASASFADVPRIWLYQGGITENEINATGQDIERYRELNRARTDYFERLHADGQMRLFPDGKICYPASTGIGTAGRGLTISFMGLQTDRDDVVMQSLENPKQTSAFDYSEHFSPKSPKFSRAMAVKIGNYVTTWVSGTASILNSETVHVGDVEKQTEQTLDNIQGLIGEENLAAHGLQGAGATLEDLAKVRVYVRRPEHYPICKAVCERRLGAVPIIYAVADVCRSDLLVEIEGVAFTSS